MQIIRDKKVKLFTAPLCKVVEGSIFKFKGDKMPMLRLGGGCGYCELGEAFESVEELDREEIDNSMEKVVVYGELKSISV